MYIKKIVINNIKSIKHLTLDFDEPYKGWHVFLGNNGAGKSTILKAVSLCFLGVKQGYALKQNFKNWITKGAEEASCELELVLDEKQDRIAKRVMGINPKFLLKINDKGNLNYSCILPNGSSLIDSFNSTHGFYSAAFGPYRRLGEEMTKNVVKFSDGNLENHITLFDSKYDLTTAVQWLKDLKFAQLSNPKEKNAFDKIIWLINNSDLLPGEVTIEQVNHEGVFFLDGNDESIEISELSDGYQSIFSLTIEILRQISKRFNLEEVLKINEDKSFSIAATGVILIDEVDIHLHPQWQSKIGGWFKTHFPKIQFLVSTHSPIICQSAEGGSIWKIEHFKTNKPSSKLIGQNFKRLVYGSLTDAIGTDSFGEEGIERSEKSKELLDKLALLNRKAIRGLATKKELVAIKDLKSILPSE